MAVAEDAAATDAAEAMATGTAGATTTTTKAEMQKRRVSWKNQILDARLLF